MVWVSGKLKGFYVLAAVAALDGVEAGRHRHAHELFHEKRGIEGETCLPSCTTIYTTITGPAGRKFKLGVVRQHLGTHG